MDLSLKNIPIITEELGKIAGTSSHGKPLDIPDEVGRLIKHSAAIPNTILRARKNVIARAIMGWQHVGRTEAIPEANDCRRWFFTDGVKVWKRAKELDYKKHQEYMAEVESSDSKKIELTNEILRQHLTVLCGVLCYRHEDFSPPSPCSDPVRIRGMGYEVYIPLAEAQQRIGCDEPMCKYFIEPTLQANHLDYELYTDTICDECESHHKPWDQ